MEATLVSIKTGMDKEDVVCMYNGISLSHKKEWNNVICSNTDGLRDGHTAWSSVRAGQIAYDTNHFLSLNSLAADTHSPSRSHLLILCVCHHLLSLLQLQPHTETKLGLYLLRLPSALPTTWDSHPDIFPGSTVHVPTANSFPDYLILYHCQAHAINPTESTPP